MIPVFDGCDGDEYARKAITGLTSYMRHNDWVEPYIFSNVDLRWVEKYGINFINVNDVVGYDITKAFAPKDNWPSQHFWRLVLPRYFYEQGYKYSIAVDAGDTFCVRSFETPMSIDRYIATPIGKRARSGVGYDFKTCANGLGNRLYGDKFKTILNGNEINIGDLPGVHTGVMLFNNAFIAEWEQIFKDEFAEISKTETVAHAQALINALSMKYYPMLEPDMYLDDKFHFRFLKAVKNPELLRLKDPYIYICHWTGRQPPWIRQVNSDRVPKKQRHLYELRKKYALMWRELYREIFGKEIEIHESEGK
jgi:hypothetical protein